MTVERQLTLGKTRTGVVSASNPNHSCHEEAPNTPATSTPEEQHPQSLPRGRENKRLNRTDLPESTRLVQTKLTGTNISEAECHCGKKLKNSPVEGYESIKQRLDVNQRRRSSSALLSQLVRRRRSKVRRHAPVLMTSAMHDSTKWNQFDGDLKKEF